MQRRAVAAGILMVLLLVTAACGQKPGVSSKIEGVAGGFGGLPGGIPEGATVDEEGNIISESGEIIGNVNDPSSLAGGTSTSTTGSGTTGSGTTGSGSGSGTGSGSGGPSNPIGGGSTTTGVSQKSIKVGIHAPLTGAAPVPSDSVDKGKDLYFRWMAHNKQSLFGRGVEAVLKNDQYNPSTAVAVCKEMVERDQVFLLSGAAGTDQIVACARYAESVGVPYLGAGVTESLVENYRTFFALSMTYPAQGPLLADFLKSKLGASGEKNGVVMYDTTSFNDAHDSFVSAMQKAGMSVDYDRRFSKNAGAQEARQVVRDLQLAQIENVFILAAPVWWLQILKQAGTQNYKPQWVGIGISMTFDTVASVGCADANNAIDGAKFFAPFPAWIDRLKYDPDVDKAYQQFYGNQTKDDFVWLSWSSGKTMWELLKRTGKDLTRENFIASTEKQRNVNNGIGPVLNFSPSDHFGADTVYVSQAQCSDRRWHTIVTPPTNDF